MSAKPERQRETAVLVMTDLHYGKKTSSFKPTDFAERLDAIASRAESIKKHLKSSEFDELVVCILGDVNDGTDIYATQAHHQAISDVEEQADQLTDLLVPYFARLKKVWQKVRIECVPGNHGRAGKFAHEAANWDVVAYKYLRNKLQYAELDIPLHLNPKQANVFMRIAEIRKHRFLLYHGHDIRSFGNIPWYGILLRTARWNLTEKLAPFDVVLMGHFHTFGCWAFNRVTAMISGTMITDDDWALQSLGWESANKWWMFGVSDKRPITWKFGLEL
jgi:DNA polymerase II small subunit/DNA polymerase delta subunit B